MSIGSELLRVLINIAIVLLAGGMLYEFFNWTIRNVIIPIGDLNRNLDQIPNLLTKYAKAFSNSENISRNNLSSVANETKVLAGRILAGRDIIPVYNFFFANWCSSRL